MSNGISYISYGSWDVSVMKPLTDPHYGPRHNVKIRPAPGNWTCPLCKYEWSLFFISTAHPSKIQHVGLLKNNKYKTQLGHIYLLLVTLFRFQ